MASYNLQSSGTFDQFQPTSYSYEKELSFVVYGSNGTISAISILWPVIGYFDQSDSNVEYNIQTTSPFIYTDTTPPPVLQIPVTITGTFDQVNPNLMFTRYPLGNYYITSTNGTKPAVIIYHNANLIIQNKPSMFNNAPSSIFGLVYPRNYTIFRKLTSPTTSTSFGFFTLRSIRASTQKIFRINQTYPKNLY